MKKLFVIVFAVATAFLFNGCASIFGKSEYHVVFSTNAPNAHVKIQQAYSGVVIASGQAPFATTLKSSDRFLSAASYLCEVNTADGKRQLRPINAQVNPWVFGNFILGGIIGIAIDGGTGAMYELDENYYIHFSEFDPINNSEIKTTNQDNTIENKTSEKEQDTHIEKEAASVTPIKE